MATLVLSTVGSVLGGPIGGAIGSLLGRSIDSAIFAPKGSEGPRLTELALQTSSYGTQIPKLFGTMRVAGTVIWATDLIESRSTSRSAKGQPSVSTYSYAASFAVLLSARRVIDVRRIWADGTLLRGAAGDFKTATGFRLHPGGEDQAIDPLIGSAEGIGAGGATPAHRGCAYAVFEQMQLADYGNRIPSLTFEVVADAGDVGVGAIATALAPEVTGSVDLALGGFAASGGSVRAVLDTLAQAGGAWFAADGAGVVMRGGVGGDGDGAASVADAGFAADARGVTKARKVASVDTAPVSVTVGHYDPARDYQAGLQRARRPGAGQRDLRVEVPAAIPGGTAKAIAEAVLARALAERTVRTVATGFAGLAVSPGARVTIAGEAGLWRVSEAKTEAMVTRLALVPVAPAALGAVATSGRVLAAADAVVGRTIVHAFETPSLDDQPATTPRLTIAAAGEAGGWRQAGLLYSIDDGASWVAAGATAAPAVLGTVAVVAPAGPATLIDTRGAFVVDLAHAGMVLGDADAGGLDAGANLAMIGDELVQFGRAVPLGGTRWRLHELLRGRRGTEAATGTQRAGDRFVLIEADAARTIDLPVCAIGREVRVMAFGVGDDAGPVETRLMLRGASVVPPSPAQLGATIAGDGTATLRWVRRSRAGWRWIDGVDAPLGEEAEAYRVSIVTPLGHRDVDLTTASLTIAAADRAAGAATIAVRQRGTFGESLASTIVVEGLGG